MLREATEVKESYGKPRKVKGIVKRRLSSHPIEMKNVDLEIAERLHRRQPYNVIARELRVSTKTISKVSKLVNSGAIMVGKDGKAFHVEVTKVAETKPRSLPQDLWMELLGVAHLEGREPNDVLRDLVELHRALMLERMNLSEIRWVLNFLKEAFRRGWKVDWLTSILTRLWNAGFMNLSQPALEWLTRFLEAEKQRGTKINQLVQTLMKTRAEWEEDIKEAYDVGLRDGLRVFESAYVKSVREVSNDPQRRRLLYELGRLARAQALMDARP